MKDYQSIQQNLKDTSDENDAIINPPVPIPDSASFERKSFSLFGTVVFGFLLAYSFLVNTQNNTMESAPENAGAASLIPRPCLPGRRNDRCGPDNVCCPESIPFGLFGVCKACCVDSDCRLKIEHEQPPAAGEFGKAFCVDNQCQAYKNGESSQIPSDGLYPVYTPSETLDNSASFRKYMMPRKVYDGPIMEQGWHIDFNEQEGSFDGIEFNGTHLTIPSFEYMHAGYSRSYNHYDEHETGIVTLIMADNKYSVVADYPKFGFVEKYHTLTYDGVKDFSRGEYIKEKAEEQIAAEPEWDRLAWVTRAYVIAIASLRRAIIPRQVEAGLDLANAWQVRRYVNSYPAKDFGSVSPSSSTIWASHSEKAKQAVAHAKNHTFEREYLKSEMHCKHFERIDGVSYTDSTVTFPVGRPITSFTGEMVNSPVHYLGLGVGHTTFNYDPSTRTLEMFMQTFAHSRQHSDVQFPGPYPNGLWVAPVSDGSDYVVDPDIDGRGDKYYKPEAPADDLTNPTGSADFTLWARPVEETCSEMYLKDDLWENIDVEKAALASNGLYEAVSQQLDLLKAIVGGMPCAHSWLRSDYGDATHGLDSNEIGVWIHSLGEVRGDKTREVFLTNFWNGWECFYGNKCE